MENMAISKAQVVENLRYSYTNWKFVLLVAMIAEKIVST